MEVAFTAEGWNDYTSWVGGWKMMQRINRLISEAGRDPGAGTGKPERLKGDLSGFWSRRINQEHRLVYAVEGDRLTILQARYHY